MSYHFLMFVSYSDWINYDFLYAWFYWIFFLTNEHITTLIPYLPVYKPKNRSKNCPRLIHESRTEIKKSSGQKKIIFCVTIAYLKENKIKDKFFKKILPRNRKNFFFFGSKMGGQLILGIDLYMGKYGNFVLLLQEDVKFPTRITEKAKNVLSALLQKNPSTRWEKKMNERKISVYSRVSRLTDFQ